MLVIGGSIIDRRVPPHRQNRYFLDLRLTPSCPPFEYNKPQNLRHFIRRVRETIKAAEECVTFLWLRNFQVTLSYTDDVVRKEVQIVYRHSSISAVFISVIFNLQQFIILSYIPPLYYYYPAFASTVSFLKLHINSVNRGMPV